MLIKKQLGIRLLSLALAIGLAYIVNSESNAGQMALLVPVELKNIPGDKILLKQSDRQVALTVRGPSLLLSEIAAKPPVLKVSLPENSEDRLSIMLREEDLDLPSYVQVISIEPRSIDLTLDVLRIKILPVVVPKIGTISEGLRLDELKVTPDKVEIQGPSGVLQEISVLETWPLDLRKIQKNSKEELALRLPPNITKASIQNVIVDLNISAVTEELEFKNIAVEIRATSPNAWQLSPSKVTVTVLGAKAALEHLNKSEIVPYVRFLDDPDFKAKLAKGELQRLPVSVDLPKGLKVRQIMPAELQVKRLAGRTSNLKK